MEEKAERVTVSIRAGPPSSPRPNQRLRQRVRKMQYTRRISARINRQKDIVWQENPDRVLKYRASHLHYYGWIPYLRIKNLKATVFANGKLHFQTLVLLLWVALVHITGLGFDIEDLRGFVKMFGTAYAGSIFNIGTLVVFILALFISLVINRWWAIRMACEVGCEIHILTHTKFRFPTNAKLSSNTIDLSMMLSSVVRNEWDWHDPSTRRARSELTRLLNLGHLLVIAQADGQSKHFKPSEKCRNVMNFVREGFRKLGRCIVIHGQTKRDSVLNRSVTSRTWVKKARDIGFDDLANEGLINIDEWELIQDAESKGIPRYLCVYYWAEALIYKCHAAGWIVDGQQMLPLMLNKFSSIVDASSHIFTNINSQMPYPYVHLVSFVVHVYLFTVATWFGAFLFVGIDNTDHGSVEAPPPDTSPTTTNPMNVLPSMLESWLWGSDKQMKRKYWTATWCYIFTAVANVVFQGLLDMHSLLDNPFGSHCAKFPLRAQVTEVLNATRTMLTHAEKMPAAFKDVFQLETAASDVSGCEERGYSEFADFLSPPSLARINIRGPSSEGHTPESVLPHESMPSPIIRDAKGRRAPDLRAYSLPIREKKVHFARCSSDSHVENKLREQNSDPHHQGTQTSNQESSGTVSGYADIDKEETSTSEDGEVACTSMGCFRCAVNAQNEVVFGNLAPRSSRTSGDAAIQEIYLQNAVSEALKSSEIKSGSPLRLHEDC